ncbi:hypothetical protein BDP27DRAFT_179954 [Rhodocollybia butyracea]|uniref:Uncharacterized protein n=1 Tax=Rhodocollybia butyracea TaxID=206335 RepID=A0A9P5U354_9AGAR|nr:hypothetical protein BDP27DRAFT_179954 [Rhodocollybia butyracea]
MSAALPYKPSSSKNKMATPTSNGNGNSGRSGIPTLRSLRTLFAPASSQQSKTDSPSRPSLNLPPSRPSINLTPARPSLNLVPSNAGHDKSNSMLGSSSSLDIVRRSMTLGRKSSSRSVSRDSRDETKHQEIVTDVMDISADSPVLDAGVDLSTIVEADTSVTSGISMAESLSKHLPALPTSESPPPTDSPSPSPSPYFSPSPSPRPRSPSASASSLHLPLSPSSIHAQVHSALQVDPALAALLSPHNLSLHSPKLSPGSQGSSVPSSPTGGFKLLSSKTHSTPYSSLRVKNASHLGLVRPSYVRSPSSDDSFASISRPPLRPGSSLGTSASGSSTVPRIRTRSMSVDGQQPRPTSAAETLATSTGRRDPSVLARRRHPAIHARTLSQFNEYRPSQSEAGDELSSNAQRKLHQRPAITEWLGPRTAKAFKAAGLINPGRDGLSPAHNSHSYFDVSPSSLSAPSSPLRPRFRPRSSDSPHSPRTPSPSPTNASHMQGERAQHPRSASVAASAISARSAGSVRSASVKSGSIRSASTAPTSAGASASLSAQATREYLMQSQSSQSNKVSTTPFASSSSSTLNLNLPNFASPALSASSPSITHSSSSTSELQHLKDQHSAETSALLAALSDAQRTAKVLRAENTELRQALALADSQQEEWSKERALLEKQLIEAKAQVKGRKQDEIKSMKVLEEEKKVLVEVNSRLEIRLEEAETRTAEAEGRLVVMAEVQKTNHKLRHALHAARREKATIEAEAEARAEEALRRIEELEDALAEVSGAIGDTIGMSRNRTTSLTTDPEAFDDENSITYTPRSSSESSSRPPSIFPLPPENMSLLMCEEGEDLGREGPEHSELSDLSELDRVLGNGVAAEASPQSTDSDFDSLDTNERKWRKSMRILQANGSSSSSQSSPHDDSFRLPSSSPEFSASRIPRGPPEPEAHEQSPEYDEYEDGGAGNATIYDIEEDSIISDDEFDPTMHANLVQYQPQPHSSALEEDDGTTTSFEGTGTPGSPGSLLWMHPSDERHLGDLSTLSGSVDDLSLDP